MGVQHKLSDVCGLLPRRPSEYWAACKFLGRLGDVLDLKVHQEGLHCSGLCRLLASSTLFSSAQSFNARRPMLVSSSLVLVLNFDVH
jgi:hypothetical protein